MTRRRAAPLGAALAVALSCAPGKGASTPRPTARVTIETASGPARVEVEVARTSAELERGLMWRKSLAPDAGMLFVFSQSDVQTFWMKNTLVPLDMIFISDDARVVGVVERAEPLTTTGRTVGVPSRYVLEVNGGWSAAHGVRKGDAVRFEGVY